MKSHLKKLIVLIILSFTVVFTVQLRVICRGIIQFRFRPTNTAGCVSFCDGQFVTPEGQKPVTNRNGAITYGYHWWPNVIFWRGDMDEPLIMPVQEIEIKEIPAAPAPAPEPPPQPKTNPPPMQTALETIENNGAVNISNVIVWNGGMGSFIGLNFTITNLIVTNEYPKILRHNPVGDDRWSWGWNGLIEQEKTPQRIHWPDPGIVIETSDEHDQLTTLWR